VGPPRAAERGGRPMTSDLSSHLARVTTEDRLRAAAERRRTDSLAEALDGTPAAPGRQRALVRLSLLLSRRGDLATDRQQR
jgi:hypothetical protein